MNNTLKTVQSKPQQAGIYADAHSVRLTCWLGCIYFILFRRLHKRGNKERLSLFLKNAVKVCALFAPFLLFQSYGISLIKHNSTLRHSFTSGMMSFWQPEFIFQIFTSIFYPFYAIGYCFIVFFSILTFVSFAYSS